MQKDAAEAVFQALHERRSIRKFTDEPVDRDDVLAVIDAGRWAPSGRNHQPWKFLAVFAGDPRQDALARCTKYERIVRDAGALLCVFLDKERMYHTMKDYQGAGACIQNMLLAVHALGLGAVWLGEIVNQAPQVFDTLDLDPETLELMAVVAIGRPDEPGHSTRMELNDFLLEAF